VRHDYRPRSGCPDILIQPTQPLLAERIIPIVLLHTTAGLKLPLPECLPMIRPRVTDTGDHENSHGRVVYIHGNRSPLLLNTAGEQAKTSSSAARAGYSIQCRNTRSGDILQA
jgi:hypothetical protein